MADQGIGDPSDSRASDVAGNWTVISLLKGILHSGGGGGGGGAVTVADGSDVTEGAIADAAVTAGATGTVSAKLRSISRDVGTVATASATQATAAKQDTGNTSLSTIATNTTGASTAANQATGNTSLSNIDTNAGATSDAAVTAGATGSISAKLRAISRDIVANIVLKAGSAIIGQVGVDQTTPGTTDSVTVKASSGIGSLTETAPANDTASSGLNGRLQRIAQNITTLIGSVLKVVGNVAIGASASGSPVLIGGKDTAGNVEYIFTDTTGRTIVVGPVADGATAAGNPVIIAGVDSGGLSQQLAVSSAGLISTVATISGADAVSNSHGFLTTTAGSANNLGVFGSQFNGSTWDRTRNNNSTTVLTSAARTATVSTDVTNYNGKTFRVILNITVAPNTASTLTLSIRVKDSISSNYVTLLTGVAETGSVDTGVVPVTKTYAVGAGLVATANVSAAEALGRTMNVNVVHSNSDSWTYSVSVEIVN